MFLCFWSFRSQVLTKYIRKLGVSPEWSVTDVLGLTPDMLQWIPRPVKAFILLFPISEKVCPKCCLDWAWRTR